MATLPKGSKKPAGRRSYNWATIIYPESVHDDYMDIIERSGVQAVISPLHDKDELESPPPDGTSPFKKPHYHIIFHFSSLKSQAQVREFVESFGGVGAESVKSMDGSVVYLWHGNSPDKAQYDKADCFCINGFKVERYMPKLDRDVGFAEVIKYIEMTGEVYYSDLICNLIEDRPDLLPICRKDSYALVNYLKSREKQIKERQEDRNSRGRMLPPRPDGWHPTALDFEEI